ncbi:MAG: VWA domain-containing protein [Helicobacteraceae bacterium]|jgi:uncharacterized protein YegL|nr:VWA domain-containing protein [Helicobacteraceae bacterium]
MSNVRKICVALAVALLPLNAAAIDVVKPTPSFQIDVVFVLDTTGSMSGLIENAKRKIWTIANTIVDQNPNSTIRVGLAGYRDIGDDYVVRYYPLTTDVQDIYAKLLAFEASGGGDTPESVNEALDIAVTKMGWIESASKRSVRIIFLVGDAPPHMDYDQDRKYPEIIAEAKRRGIVINAVQAGDMQSTRKIWKEIASLGGGEYIAIAQDGGRTIVIETPYDDEIIIIQRKINATIVPYGRIEKQRFVAEKRASYEAAPKDSSIEMSKFINKNSGGAITGDGDLVGDVNNKVVTLDKVPVKELPENMQKMTAKERERYIAEQTKLREGLSKELIEKIKLRDDFVKAAEAKEKPVGDSFDRAVSRTLKKQAKE